MLVDVHSSWRLVAPLDLAHGSQASHRQHLLFYILPSRFWSWSSSSQRAESLRRSVACVSHHRERNSFMAKGPRCLTGSACASHPDRTRELAPSPSNNSGNQQSPRTSAPSRQLRWTRAVLAHSSLERQTSWPLDAASCSRRCLERPPLAHSWCSAC